MPTKAQISQFALVSCNVIMQIPYQDIVKMIFNNEDKCCTASLGTLKFR